MKTPFPYSTRFRAVMQYDEIGRLLTQSRRAVGFETGAAHQLAGVDASLILEPGQLVAAVGQFRLARGERPKRDRLLPVRLPEAREFGAHARGALLDDGHYRIEHGAGMHHVAQRPRLREHRDRRLARKLLERGRAFEPRLLLLG